MSLPAEFEIELYCESLQLTKVIAVSCPTFPGSFKDITDAVEEKCSIPSYSQKIWIQQNEVVPSSNNTPSSYYLQSGDTIKITYQTKCDCKKVKKAIQWLAEGIEAVHNIKQCKTEEMVKDLYQKNITIFEECDSISDLFEDLFTPWSEEGKKMNADYFDHLGGVTMLVKIHEEMSSLRNKSLFAELHSISEDYESMLCSAFGMFSSDASLRKYVTVCGGLDRCLATFLAYPATDWKHRKMWHFGLFALCNLSDIPENQLYFSQKQDVIDQLVSVIKTRNIGFTRMAIMVLLNFTQTKETHVNIFREDLICRVIDDVKFPIKRHRTQTVAKILQSHTGIMLSQMILGSCCQLKTFDRSTLITIESFLENVMEIDPMEIGRYEKQNDCYWGSFLPLVYLYEPRPFLTDDHPNYSLINHLTELSSQIIFHCLQSTLWRKEHVPVLLEEKLLDYVIMLPWFASSQSEDRSIDVVCKLASVHQLQPPPLSVICKANLSKLVFGLSKLLHINSNTQVLEII